MGRNNMQHNKATAASLRKKRMILGCSVFFIILLAVLLILHNSDAFSGHYCKSTIKDGEVMEPLPYKQAYAKAAPFLSYEVQDKLKGGGLEVLPRGIFKELQSVRLLCQPNATKAIAELLLSITSELKSPEKLGTMEVAGLDDLVDLYMECSPRGCVVPIDMRESIFNGTGRADFTLPSLCSPFVDRFIMLLQKKLPDRIEHYKKLLKYKKE